MEENININEVIIEDEKNKVNDIFQTQPEKAKDQPSESKNFFNPRAMRIVLSVILILIVALLIFKIGVNVGFKKANFSYGWEENYHRNFAGPEGGFFGNFSQDNPTQANGVFGQILKIDGSAIIINGQDKMEKTVLVDDGTIIRRLSETLKVSDLKINDSVVIIGQPNGLGQIEAKFIRLIPAPLQNQGNNNVNSQPNIIFRFFQFKTK